MLFSLAASKASKVNTYATVGNFFHIWDIYKSIYDMRQFVCSVGINQRDSGVKEREEPLKNSDSVVWPGFTSVTADSSPFSSRPLYTPTFFFVFLFHSAGPQLSILALRGTRLFEHLIKSHNDAEKRRALLRK